MQSPTSNTAHLICYLAAHQPPSYWRLIAGARAAQAVTAEEAARLSHQQPLTALIAATSLTAFQRELPPSVRADEALLLVEDQLSQPIEDITLAVFSQQGRAVDFAVICTEQLTAWQTALAEQGVLVQSWRAEISALRELWQEEQPLVLLDEANQQLEVWLAASSSFFSLPFNWLATNELQQLLTGLEIDLTPHFETLSLAEKLGWLAPTLARQPELWPATGWQKLLRHQKLRQVRQAAQKLGRHLAGLAPYKKQLLPWGLSSILLMLAGLFHWLQPPQVDAYWIQTATQFEQQLGVALTNPYAEQRFNQQLASLGEQLSYQEMRWQAWQELNQLLKEYPDIQLTGLQLNQQGLAASLLAPTALLEAFMSDLNALGGQVESTAAEQAVSQVKWQITEEELANF